MSWVLVPAPFEMLECEQLGQFVGTNADKACEDSDGKQRACMSACKTSGIFNTVVDESDLDKIVLVREALRRKSFYFIPFYELLFVDVSRTSSFCTDRSVLFGLHDWKIDHTGVIRLSAVAGGQVNQRDLPNSTSSSGPPSTCFPDFLGLS
ncbi:hypothetical protein GYMLUDRAFT_250483 [Collybiopsis luxurians FD-317 M1]|uniref:Uncharacterized protein n=1 Tax=Collybiopsis luxurians FD-317 M1 TaxID=944289 RepID=A0A0D0BFE6_9AGAR|nr:hypothetical protein GYMLUDRAFT_250483 [Collybiopsis luxurians FD-317 M1]